MSDPAILKQILEFLKEGGAAGALLLVIGVLLVWIKREFLREKTTLTDLVRSNTESNQKMAEGNQKIAEAVNKSTDRIDAFVRTVETIANAFDRKRR